jgi:hypothetical protein
VGDPIPGLDARDRFGRFPSLAMVTGISRLPTPTTALAVMCACSALGVAVGSSTGQILMVKTQLVTLHLDASVSP